MAKPPRNPYDVKLTPEQRKQLGIWIARELQAAIDAKSTPDASVDYWWQLYEQARTRLAKNLPWPDAADLTSYLGTQTVDSIQARLIKTIMVDPVWSVEGWGMSAGKAPFVEEFHRWKVEEERLQGVLDVLALTALVEMAAILGVLNVLVKPVLSFLSCGLIVRTMGLFLIVINALSLWRASWIAQNWFGIGFVVDGFWPAVWGSILVRLVSFFLSTVLLKDTGTR